MDGAPRSPCSHVTIRRWTRVGSRFRFSVRRWSAFGFIRLIKRVFYSRRDKQVIVNCHVCVLSVQELSLLTPVLSASNLQPIPFAFIVLVLESSKIGVLSSISYQHFFFSFFLRDIIKYKR